ncbi:MAG: methyl-accepting chemotaxis protein, partial [Massilia sp.]|nr:methyl-accepting chemotaxis protein [Massilia sp.]
GAATAGEAAGQRLQGLARSAFTLYLRDVHDVLELAAVDRSMGANAMSKAERSFDVVERHLGALAALEQSLSERAANDARADFRAAAVLMPSLIALSVLLALGITMAVRAAMLKDVRAIGAAASGLAQGDLRVPPRHYGRDEIAETSRALDASIRNLNRTLRTIRDGARALDPGAAVGTPGLATPGVATPDVATVKPAGFQRQRVRDTAATAGALQRQASELQRSVAGFKLDEGSPAPDLRCVGGLEEPPALKGGGRLRLASRKPKGGEGAYS